MLGVLVKEHHICHMYTQTIKLSLPVHSANQSCLSQSLRGALCMSAICGRDGGREGERQGGRE